MYASEVDFFRSQVFIGPFALLAIVMNLSFDVACFFFLVLSFLIFLDLSENCS